MKEFIEKLIERLEEESYEIELDGAVVASTKTVIELSKVKEISGKFAEEYNGAWIPCENELPEENGYYLITIKYYHLHNNVTMGCFFDDGEWYKIDKDDKVIAWQLLPAPYNPKGE